ncbi:putative protein isoform X2 [Capsicum chacoense]
MAFNANVLVIFSLVLVIISLEVIADPALPVANDVQNVVEMNNKTLQGRGNGGGGDWRPEKDGGGSPVKGCGGSDRDNKGLGKYKGEKR